MPCRIERDVKLKLCGWAFACDEPFCKRVRFAIGTGKWPSVKREMQKHGWDIRSPRGEMVNPALVNCMCPAHAARKHEAAGTLFGVIHYGS